MGSSQMPLPALDLLAGMGQGVGGGGEDDDKEDGEGDESQRFEDATHAAA